MATHLTISHSSLAEAPPPIKQPSTTSTSHSKANPHKIHFGRDFVLHSPRSLETSIQSEHGLSALAELFRHPKNVRQAHLFSKLGAAHHLAFLSSLTSSPFKWIQTSIHTWQREFLRATNEEKLAIIQGATLEQLNYIPTSCLQKMLQNYIEILDDDTIDRLVLKLSLNEKIGVFWSISYNQLPRFTAACRATVAADLRLADSMGSCFLACCYPSAQAFLKEKNRISIQKMISCYPDELLLTALQTLTLDNLLKLLEGLDLKSFNRICGIFQTHNPEKFLLLAALVNRGCSCFGTFLTYLTPTEQIMFLENDSEELTLSQQILAMRQFNEDQLLAFLNINPETVSLESLRIALPYLPPSKLLALAISTRCHNHLKELLANMDDDMIALVAQAIDSKERIKALLTHAQHIHRADLFIGIFKYATCLSIEESREIFSVFFHNFSSIISPILAAASSSIHTFFTSLRVEDLAGHGMTAVSISTLWQLADHHTRQFLATRNNIQSMAQVATLHIVPKTIRENIAHMLEDVQPVHLLCTDFLRNGFNLRHHALQSLGVNMTPAGFSLGITPDELRPLIASGMSAGQATTAIYTNLRDALHAIGVTDEVLGSLDLSYEEILEKGLRGDNLAVKHVGDVATFTTFMHSATADPL